MLVLMYILAVSGGSNGRCLEHEKQALLKFKEGLIDYGNLASWAIEKDCCRWRGVECDNRAGHIIRLDLHPVFSHADHDDFTWTPMDGVISSLLLDLRHLSHLDLSRNQFTKIPGFIGSLKELVYLNLSVLQLIDSIVHPSTFPLLLNMSNKLTALHLSKNHLNGIIPISFAHMGSSLGNLRKLRTLLLNGNYINEPLPVILEKPSGCVKDSLQVLDLSVNQIKGSLPEIITRFSSLKELCPDDNKLDGALPDNVGNLSSLAVLNLARNKLTGSLPQSIGLMSGLKVLDVSSNSFNDFTSEIHFLKLSKLKFLTLSFNSLSLNFSSGWIPPFQLNTINLRCNNQLSGNLPDCWMNFKQLVVLNLESNSLSGVIPSSFGSLHKLQTSNEFSGNIPTTLCKLNHLQLLNLSLNHLSSTIPTCLQNLTAMTRNLLSGIIPKEVGQLRAPESLDLSTNRLSGEIPLSLADCSFLSCLNLSNNNPSGKIPLSTQLQSFLVESYMGNVGLCGLPLNAICPEDEKQQDGGVEHSNLDDEKLYKGSGFYVSLIIGFTLGFWGLCWTLLFNWPGKPASFRFFDNMVDWLSLKMALIAAKVKRRLTS
uniref:Uncharacterized protein n=1 Tax=Gossypium raimondii TaxID=29730 RepID=A0A0D2TFI9_GOSRA|nr:hypothetical protein B456_007G154700 [Gossypium raimondii]